MSIKFLKQKNLNELYSAVGDNLERYRSGNFDELLTSEATHEFDKITISHDAIKNIKGNDKDDANNCLILFNGIEGMTPYHARDARIWVYITHTLFLEYSRNRWPIPSDDKKAITHIILHFFTTNFRNFHRDNAASRLWWSAFACSKVKTIPLNKSLELLFYRQDVRQNLLDRSSTSRIDNLYSVFMHKLDASFQTDEKSLFNKVKNHEYMKELNFLGGSNVLEALSIEDSAQILQGVDNLIFGEDISINLNGLEKELQPIDGDSRMDDSDDTPVSVKHESTEDELRAILEGLRDEIVKVFPNTPDDKRLLSPHIIAGLMYQKPRDIEEFIAMFPHYMREQISGEESEKYLEIVLQIIDDHT